MTKKDLPEELHKILKALGGRGSIIDICKAFWDLNKNDVESSGDLFYTWQYDIRWAATNLRQSLKMKSAKASPRGIWELKK